MTRRNKRASLPKASKTNPVLIHKKVTDESVTRKLFGFIKDYYTSTEIRYDVGLQFEEERASIKRRSVFGLRSYNTYKGVYKWSYDKPIEVKSQAQD